MKICGLHQRAILIIFHSLTFRNAFNIIRYRLFSSIDVIHGKLSMKLTICQVAFILYATVIQVINILAGVTLAMEMPATILHYHLLQGGNTPQAIGSFEVSPGKNISDAIELFPAQLLH